MRLLRFPVLSALAIGLSGLVGCAGHPFVKSDSLTTPEGVTISLLNQKCGRMTWDRNSDVLDLDVVAQVRNSGVEPVEIVPSQLLLVARGNVTRPKRSDETTFVAPGVSTPVRVHYRRVGNAKCNESMSLSVDGAIEVGGRTLGLRPLTFVPERSDG
jgi:hypothetical protein